MDRAGPRPAGGLHQAGHLIRQFALPVAVVRNCCRHIQFRPDIGAENSGLQNRLVGSGSPEPGRPVGRQQDQRHMALGCLHGRREQFRHGRARRCDDGCRLAGGQGPAQGLERRASFVVVDGVGSRFLAPDVKDQGRGPGTRTNAEVPDPRCHQGLDNHIGQLEAGGIGLHHAGHQDWAVRAWCMGWNFHSVSSHSDSGWLPATIPAPANSQARALWITAERMPTQNVPCPKRSN